MPWGTRPWGAGAGIARTSAATRTPLGHELPLLPVQCPRVALLSRGGLPAGAGREPRAIGAAHGGDRGDFLWVPGGKLVAAGAWIHFGPWESHWVMKVVRVAQTAPGTAARRRAGHGAHPAGTDPS